jgi:hypothetical protein
VSFGGSICPRPCRQGRAEAQRPASSSDDGQPEDEAGGGEGLAGHQEAAQKVMLTGASQAWVLCLVPVAIVLCVSRADPVYGCQTRTKSPILHAE